jgi:dihydrodipicolinate synthase/N-acetylneuraminate lyase
MTAEGRVDEASVVRMVAHHVDLGVAGVMLAGTCGEGPWLRDRDREALVRTTVEAARGKLTVALQVTDSSSVRVLDNIDRAAAWVWKSQWWPRPRFFSMRPRSGCSGHYTEIARASVPAGGPL